MLRKILDKIDSYLIACKKTMITQRITIGLLLSVSVVFAATLRKEIFFSELSNNASNMATSTSHAAMNCTEFSLLCHMVENEIITSETFEEKIRNRTYILPLNTSDNFKDCVLYPECNWKIHKTSGEFIGAFWALGEVLGLGAMLIVFCISKIREACCLQTCSDSNYIKLTDLCTGFRNNLASFFNRQNNNPMRNNNAVNIRDNIHTWNLRRQRI